jgi:hypothetical protein
MTTTRSRANRKAMVPSAEVKCTSSSAEAMTAITLAADCTVSMSRVIRCINCSRVPSSKSRPDEDRLSLKRTSAAVIAATNVTAMPIQKGTASVLARALLMLNGWLTQSSAPQRYCHVARVLFGTREGWLELAFQHHYILVASVAGATVVDKLCSLSAGGLQELFSLRNFKLGELPSSGIGFFGITQRRVIGRSNH